MNALFNLPLNHNVGRTERIISVIAGSLLMFHGLRRGKKLTEVPVGSYLLLRGITGLCPVRQSFLGNKKEITNGIPLAQPHNIEIDTSVIVNRPRHEVYAFWRKLENLPLFMKHLQSVTVVDEKTSLWTAKVPGGIANIDWESEITNDIPNERISWKSLPESEIRNSGNVQFIDAGPDKTEIHAIISYEAPGGIIGEKVGKMLNPVFEKLVKDDIKNFKKYMENKSSSVDHLKI